jgi:cytochrome c553
MIGAILVLKIITVRYFKHMEAKLIPYLGIALFLFSFLLVALVLPFSLREVYLEINALGDDAMVESRLQRVRYLLPTTGLKDEKLLNDLASKQGLIAGRRIMTAKCVQCHDLRTVLARPRTPKAWQQTISRMANRSTILNPITEDDQWFVTAYLVAVSPTLQETLKQRRKMENNTAQAQTSMKAAVNIVDSKDYDATRAEALFKQTCSQCHSHTQVENAPPTSQGEAIALVQRMVANGLSASETDLNVIIQYLTKTYATQTSTVVSDHSRGMQLFSERYCAGCHGSQGKNPVSDSYPKLAGQNRDYLIQQFNNIKTGVRNSGAAATMSALVQSVNDEEIAAIADYLAIQE